MKKTALLLSILTCLSGMAQESWTFSPYLGVNFVPIDNDDVYGNQLKGGMNIGFEFNWEVEENWHMDFGLSMNRRFLSYSSENTSDELSNFIDDNILQLFPDLDLNIYESTKAYSTLWTIDLPIYARYAFESGLTLFGGGYLNYLMNANTNLQTTTHIPVFEVIDPRELPLIDSSLAPFLPKNGVEETSDNTKSRFNELGYGVIFGLGYESNNWFFRANYQFGLNDLYAEADKVKININKQRAFNFSIGYRFDISATSSKEKKRYDLELIE